MTELWAMKMFAKFHSIVGLRSSKYDNRQGSFYKVWCIIPCRLTSGQGNLLFHYIDFHPGRGLMMCPTQATPPGCVQLELLRSFQQTCSVVRGVLRGRGAEGERAVESESESDDDWDSEEEEEEEGLGGKKEVVSRPFAPRVSSVVEHGVLVQCSTNSLKTTAALRYWIIG